MKHEIEVEIPKLNNINLELDDTISPKTVKLFLKHLPFTLGINLWGEEIYTDKSQIVMGEENAKSTVEIFDVAYWPPGKAICLFFGPTPLGSKNEIRPYSPVNIIGKIVNGDKKILSELKNGTKVKFRLKNSII